MLPLDPEDPDELPDVPDVPEEFLMNLKFLTASA